jgi:hypothetical protein
VSLKTEEVFVLGPYTFRRDRHGYWSRDRLPEEGGPPSRTRGIALERAATLLAEEVLRLRREREAADGPA